MSTLAQTRETWELRTAARARARAGEGDFHEALSRGTRSGFAAYLRKRRAFFDVRARRSGMALSDSAQKQGAYLGGVSYSDLRTAETKAEALAEGLVPPPDETAAYLRVLSRMSTERQIRQSSSRRGGFLSRVT